MIILIGWMLRNIKFEEEFSSYSSLIFNYGS